MDYSSPSSLGSFMTNLLKEKKVHRTKLVSDNARRCIRHNTPSTIPKSSGSRNDNQTINSSPGLKKSNDMSRWKTTAAAAAPSLSAVLAEHGTASKPINDKQFRRRINKPSKVIPSRSMAPPLPPRSKSPHSERRKQLQQKQQRQQQLYLKRQQQQQQQRQDSQLQQRVQQYYAKLLPPSCPQRRFSLESCSSCSTASSNSKFVERTRSSPQLGLYFRKRPAPLASRRTIV